MNASPREWLRLDPEAGVLARRSIALRLLLMIGALFSGLALLAHIVSGIPLPLALAGTVLFAAVLVRLVWTRLIPPRRTAVAMVAGIGLVSGLAATAVYDVARFLLSRWDPSPYNPFEAVRIFGALLVGEEAPATLVFAAGAGFHLMNGVMFGVGYALLLGNRGVLAGVAWALGLELFQLVLYPGWLRIQFVREFAQISAASHVAYGATLGACVRASLIMLRRRGFRALRRDVDE